VKYLIQAGDGDGFNNTNILSLLAWTP